MVFLGCLFIALFPLIYIIIRIYYRSVVVPLKAEVPLTSFSSMSVTTLPGCHGNTQGSMRFNRGALQVFSYTVLRKLKICRNKDSHHLIISTMKIVPVPEASLVPFNITDLAPLVHEVWFPNQRAVSKDPQTGFSSDDVLRFHLYRMVRG